MRSRIATRRAAAALLGAALFLPAVQAQAAVMVAYDDKVSNNPEAKGWATDDRDNAASDDVGADGNSVYTVYTRSASDDTDRYLHNKSGSAAGAVYSGSGSNILRVKACVSETGPDDCGGWNYWG